MALIQDLLAAGADPNMTNLSGFTPFDLALGSSRKALKRVTSRMTDPHLLGGMECLARSLTPDRLSSLRSGASLLLRPSHYQHRSQSPLTSCQNSPRRRSPATCPSTPCRMITSPSGTSQRGRRSASASLRKVKTRLL